MQEPATAPWGLRISDADFQKLKAGFEPQDQDDKWHVSVKDQTQNGDGNISVNYARSGTGIEHYILNLKPNNGSGGAQVEAITWEQNAAGIRTSEDQAKKGVVLITRSILECDFDALPEYSYEDVWNS